MGIAGRQKMEKEFDKKMVVQDTLATIESVSYTHLGMKIRLEKEPDNEYDKEAIKVTYEGLGKIGYVANSSYTVIGESMSAGRLYDKIGDTAYAKVVLVTPAGTICKICKKSLKSEQEETA